MLGGCSLIIDGELEGKSALNDGGLDAAVDASGGGTDDAGTEDAGSICAEGEQDHDGDGTCAPDCTNTPCGADQRCDDGDGEARCVCRDGFQDNDDDGRCRPDCSDVTCDTNMHCDDAAGTADCVCDEGHVGNDCDICDNAYQDNDDDGRCQPTCDSLDCGERGTCDDASGEATCTCDLRYAGDLCDDCEVGYALDDNDVCQWDGIVKNPGFDDDSAWVTVGSGLVSGGGYAKLTSDATCEGGAVQQTVTVPPRSNADVLVLRYDARTGSGFNAGPRPYVSLDAQPYRSAITFGDWTSNAICLGEGAYGRELDIVLRSARTEGNPTCGAYEDADFDDVRIEPAAVGECPAPGSGVYNGQFAVDTNWTLTSTVGSSDITMETLSMSSVGAATVTVEGSIALPVTDTAAGQAVEVVWTGAADIELTVSLQSYTLGVAPHPGGSDNVFRVCLPAWAHGGSMPISLSGRNTEGNGVALSVSSVEFVEDDRCIDSGIFQGDFETAMGAPVLLSSWTFGLNGNNGAIDPVAAISDATGPTKALDLQVNYKCTDAAGTQHVQVPAPNGTNGPAVTFDYTLPVEPATFDPWFAVCVGSVTSGQCTHQVPSASFAQSTVCLDPVTVGQVVPLVFYLDGGGGTCADQYGPAYQARVDSVVVTTHAGCPAE